MINWGKRSAVPPKRCFQRWHNKIPTPEDQGWATKYSTVPPWLQQMLPLIDALTGVPGMAFPHIQLGSGIANGRGTDALHQI